MTADHVRIAVALKETIQPAVFHISAEISVFLDREVDSDSDCVAKIWLVCNIYKEKSLYRSFLYIYSDKNVIANIPEVWIRMKCTSHRKHAIFMVGIKQWLAIVWIEYQKILMQELPNYIRSVCISQKRGFRRRKLPTFFIIDVKSNLSW